MELVSVIIAVYNCERYIRECIESILNQTYQNLEVLICDDYSADGTFKIMSSYKDDRMKLFRNDRNRGVVYTRNFLLRQAKGEYIVIQDGDDWSDQRRIEKLIKTFKQRSDVHACVSAHYRVDNVGSIKIASGENSFDVTAKDCIALAFMPATLMIRNSVFRHIGGYHAFFAGLFAEDWYWVVRIVEQFKVHYLNEPLYYYRFNPVSITNTADRKEKFIVMDLMQQLIEQRRQTGTDWVEQNDVLAIQRFKEHKFNDKKWLSEQYRIAAAVQRDGTKRLIAFRLILKAIANNPFAFRNYMTLRYVLL